MLILTRKPGESIRIGDDIVLVVKSISGKTVRLGIVAPESIPVYREELYEQKIRREQDSNSPEANEKVQSIKKTGEPR